MRDDSIAFADKAKKAGVDVVLYVEKNMCHCSLACAPLFLEASQALARIGQFVSNKMSEK